jgi:magnesium chelatase family protein
MGLAQVWGVVTSGVAGVMVMVEVDVAQGLPSVGVVGLAGLSVTEARWRARSAITNIGATWPAARITIGLYPADVPKSGTSLDLPIAVGVLVATGQVPSASVRECTFIGELGLDGSVRGVAGALAASISAQRHGIKFAYIARDNAAQVSVVPGIQAVVIRDLGHLVSVLRGEGVGDEYPPTDAAGGVAMLNGEGLMSRGGDPDFSDVRGHPYARFALEVAAAGGHHCSMVGPPGVGKSMLATRLVTILPDLPADIALDVTALVSLSGQWPIDRGLVRRPILQAPHHSASATAILGTSRGSQVLPGALTLAHHGVLFLDEAPEFSRPCLEGLRQPMESGVITIMRAAHCVTLPAQFQLVLASNPCPCGLFIGRGDGCTCTSMSRQRYRERLSGPLLDRIDVRMSLSRPTSAELDAGQGEPSADIRSRVECARGLARRRFTDEPWSLNAQLPSASLRGRWQPSPKACELVTAAERAGASLRSIDRVLRMAWTIADLDVADLPTAEHVAAAMGLRGIETRGNA